MKISGLTNAPLTAPAASTAAAGAKAQMSAAAGATTQGAAPAKAAKGIPADEATLRRALEAEQAATDFESMFSDIMLKAMRQTALPEEASNAHEIYQGMLDQEYSKSLANRGDLGIKDMVLKWMETAEPSLVEARQAMDGYKSQAAALAVRQPK